MCSCLEHPRCYRSAKCYYYGQETGCENPLYSTSPLCTFSRVWSRDSPSDSGKQTSLEVPLAAAFGQRSCVERRGEEQRGTRTQKEHRVCSTCGQDFVPCHSVVLSLKHLILLHHRRMFPLCETHFVTTLPKVIYLMNSWPWRAVPLGQH